MQSKAIIIPFITLQLSGFLCASASDHNIEIKIQRKHRPTGITFILEKYKNGLINEIKIKNAYSGLEVSNIFRIENHNDDNWIVYCKLGDGDNIIILNKSISHFFCRYEWDLIVSDMRFKTNKNQSISDEDENQLDILIKSK